ncbi:MAG TPA: aminoglycoside phosphotransferase family protein [Candidatus Hydrogenedentes bacterium]|nr:aminoglycoside phosphotransferase family protein [Candidatus Hydrogenedentota bacterium]HOL77924.1 aminoglycoside phosphotransferase family protein [Candidatus Hydrogenedentota bacterium]HPO87106.1 aminoglycoside phosphotransferase family protein [Candidatus Hydrogenedentota bacterium]
MTSSSEKTLLPTELLQACVRAYRPYRSIRFQRIFTGKFNTSFYVSADDEELVLRIAPPSDSVFLFYERDMMKQEPAIHETVLKNTEVPIAPILFFDDSRKILGRDFLLMKRLPGRPVSECASPNVDSIYHEVGQHLARVHQITSSNYGYIGAHRPMEPQSTWNEAFRIMWGKLLQDVASVGYYNQEEIEFLTELLEEKWHYFDRNVPASLLHMDIWDQNILTDGNHVTGIVDWDRALWGDPEIEFAVLDYCGISTDAFWEGYGTRRDTSEKARIRNLFYLLYEIQKYIVIRHGRNRDAKSAAAYKEHCMTLARQISLIG